MKIKYNNYTWFDGNPDGRFISTANNKSDSLLYNSHKFNKETFNDLISNRQYIDAADYAAQFHFDDPETQRAHENDIINLRRNGRVLGSIYSRIQNPADLAKVTFADNVFVDGGLERMEKNEYSQKLLQRLEEIKSTIGSTIKYDDYGKTEIDKEATDLSVTFYPAKQTLFGIDFLAEDNTNTIDNFYAASGLTANDLVNANVEVLNKDDKTILKFNKSNPLANKILYYTPTNRARHKVGDIPTSVFGGDRAATIIGYDKDGNELGSGNGISALKYLIDDAMVAKNKYFKDIASTTKGYSSTVGPMISDELINLRNALQNGDITETQYNQQAKALAPNIFSAIYTFGSGNYEMYSNYYNDNDTDETLIPVQNKDRAKLTNLINNYAPKDIDVSAMISNGKVGALITLKGTGNEEKSSTNNGKRIEIFVPGLLQEEAQAKLNTDTSIRAIQEVNSMLDWGYDYKLRDGSVLHINSNGKYIKDNTDIGKDRFIQELNKDMIIEDAVSNLKFQYMNNKGAVDNLRYEQMARLLAMDAVQDIYKNINVIVNPNTYETTVVDMFKNKYDATDIFDRKIDYNNLQYEVAHSFDEIYNIYNELMTNLNFYK